MQSSCESFGVEADVSVRRVPQLVSVMGIFRQLSVPLPPYPSLMLLSVGKMGRMTGDAGMKPMQKFRLLVLALCAPYFLALLYRLVGHPHPAKWFTPLCLFYSVAAVTSAYIYLLRHPELRLSQEEKASTVSRDKSAEGDRAGDGFSSRLA